MTHTHTRKHKHKHTTHERPGFGCAVCLPGSHRDARCGRGGGREAGTYPRNPVSISKRARCHVHMSACMCVPACPPDCLVPPDSVCYTFGFAYSENTMLKHAVQTPIWSSWLEYSALTRATRIRVPVDPHPSDLGPNVPSARPDSHGIAGRGRNVGKRAGTYPRNPGLIPGGSRFHVYVRACLPC